jgi:hypothetical protein
LRPSQRTRLERLERDLGTTLRCSTCTTNPIRLAYSGREAEEVCATCGRELISFGWRSGRMKCCDVKGLAGVRVPEPIAVPETACRLTSLRAGWHTERGGGAPLLPHGSYASARDLRFKRVLIAPSRAPAF